MLCFLVVVGCVFMCCFWVFFLLNLIKWLSIVIIGFVVYIGLVFFVFLVYFKYFDGLESKNMNFINLDMIIIGN